MKYSRLTRMAPVLACCALLCACDVFTSSEERVARAERLEARGEYSEAMIELRNVLDSQPDHWRAQYLVGKINYGIGDVDAAAKALDAIPAADAGAGKPADADVAAIAELRALIYLARGKHEELLAKIAAGELALAPPRDDVIRVQALGGLNRCAEALPLARGLVSRDARLTPVRIVIADCAARAGDAEGGLQELEAAIADAPDAADLRLARGRLQQSVGRVRDAERSWGEAIERAPGQLSVPQQIMVLSILGESQVVRNELDGARATYAKLEALAPNSSATRLIAAKLQIAAGDVAGATNTVRAIVAANPQFAPARGTLASAWLLEGRNEQARSETQWLQQNAGSQPGPRIALAMLDALAKPDLGDEERWLRIATAHKALGEPVAARVAIQRALAAAPESSQAKLFLGELELRAENFDEAARLAAARLAERPDDPAAVDMLCDARLRSRQEPLGIEEFEKLWQRRASGAVATGLFRLHKRSSSGAHLEPLERWLRQSPEDLPVRLLYADALRVDGETRKAIENYEQVIAGAPRNVPALNNLAWLYYLEKDPRSIPTARRAHELAPNAPAVQDTLGWVLVEAGSIAEGLPLLEKADQSAGAIAPDIRYHHAVALARSGKRAEARILLQGLLAEPRSFDTRGEAERLVAALE